MEKIIAFINQKGGVGKTTSCLNVGAALALKGYKVLLVDLDAQGSLTTSAGFEIEEEAPTVYEVLKGYDINAAIKDRGSYDILPADIRFSAAELELSNIPGREKLLQEALEGLKAAYDYILIDCAPSLNVVTLMGLAAANSVIIPVQAQYLPLKGMSQLLDTIAMVKKRINRQLAIAGVIVTMYDGRKTLDREVYENIAAAFPEKVLAIIPNNVALAEAPASGKDIYEYSPDSKGAAAYTELTEKIINGGKNNG